jgi:hypothetical protein
MEGRMDLRDLVKAAKRQRWRIDTTTSGHVRFTPPDPTKKACVFPGTPSDQRAIRNFLSQLRRQGFVWPPERKGKTRR